MKHKCKICKYEWIARVRKPKQCPKCKRYDWEIIIELKKREKQNE